MNTKRIYYTTFSIDSGVCNHVHRTVRAAEACIRRTARDCQAMGPRPRRIMEIESRKDISEGYSNRTGPGVVYTYPGSWPDFPPREAEEDRKARIEKRSMEREDHKKGRER